PSGSLRRAPDSRAECSACSVPVLQALPEPEPGEARRAGEGGGGGVVEVAAVLRLVAARERGGADRSHGRPAEALTAERGQGDHAEVRDRALAPRVHARDGHQLSLTEG